jgi:anti-sigma factor ChrR (cupin superfamily)
MLINADRSQLAIVHGAELPWILSPQHGVERRMLERIGEEIALATSIVRYAPHSRFPAHTHELGEEFLVLEGTFSDEHGDYPTGSYVRNPPGSRHAAFSDPGCVILVKLRQMSGDESDTVRNFASNRAWQTDSTSGTERTLLYQNTRQSVELVRLRAGAKIASRNHPRGEELFVVEGCVRWQDDSSTTLHQWSWVRNPGSNHCPIISDVESLLWIKRGHL